MATLILKNPICIIQKRLACANAASSAQNVRVLFGGELAQTKLNPAIAAKAPSMGVMVKSSNMQNLCATKRERDIDATAMQSIRMSVLMALPMPTSVLSFRISKTEFMIKTSGIKKSIDEPIATSLVCVKL